MSLVAKNPEFRELHNYYTTRRLNPLKKMQSLMAVAAKLIRVFYAMLTKGADYDPQKMVSDIRRPAVYRCKQRDVATNNRSNYTSATACPGAYDPVKEHS